MSGLWMQFGSIVKMSTLSNQELLYLRSLPIGQLTPKILKIFTFFWKIKLPENKYGPEMNPCTREDKIVLC